MLFVCDPNSSYVVFVMHPDTFTLATSTPHRTYVTHHVHYNAEGKKKKKEREREGGKDCSWQPLKQQLPTRTEGKASYSQQNHNGEREIYKINLINGMVGSEIESGCASRALYC